ncbi:MAG: ABC transporter permease subunit [Pirellulales bacterium]
MRCEWRLLRTDVGWWSVIAVLLACVSYSLYNGRVRVAERTAGVAEAQRDETDRIAKLTQLLDRIERGEAKAPDAPYRDPRNAIYVGRGSGATVAFLPDAPLAVIAVGVSDLYPHSFKVNAGSRDSFLFVDEIANPTHLLSGSFDLAFVVVYLFPLLLLALSYNVLSGEQEQGTLALTAASSAPLMTVLAGKLTVRIGVVIAVAIVSIWFQLLVNGAPLGSTGVLASFAMLALTIVLYGLFWTSLALCVNSLRRDSAFNAVTLVMLWVLLLLVAPAALNSTAQVLHPAPARAEMVLAVRNAAVDTERDRDANDARYREEHRGANDRSTDAPKVDDRTRRTLAVTVAADARADILLAHHEAQVQAQRRLSDRLAFLVPPALINDALAELSGNGHSRWDNYLARVGDFHTRWQAFFVERASRDSTLTTADYQSFPRFNAVEPPASGLATSMRRVLLSLLSVGAMTVFLLLTGRTVAKI